jgi:two-component system response regulator PilR (NtrC family)
MARLLVVDDASSMRELLELYFSEKGHQVDVAADERSAVSLFAEREHDLVITDLRLGRGSGMDVLRQVKAKRPATEVIVITAFATQEAGLEATKLGAYDFVTKTAHFKPHELEVRVNGALEKIRLARENAILRERLEGRQGLVGRSPAMRALYQMVEKVAPARTTVLITGESGTGKELVARALHGKSPRASAPFVPVNCVAIPEGLIESELFGHVKGAFTGAQGPRPGLFQAANGGTLFLDEVGELPVPLQVKLLRAIQERRVRAVGADEDEEIDVRLIAASNRDLAAEVAAGRFREDLYYRLNVIQLRVPPLRERREDVMLLADHFLRRFEAEHGRERLDLSREAKKRLDAYDFPGNVRELENLVERAVTLSDGPEVTLDALPGPLRPPAAAPLADGPLPSGFSLEAHLASIEQQLIDRALQQSHGVKKNAAAMLGLTFRQFRHRLKKLSGAPDEEEPALPATGGARKGGASEDEPLT